MSKKLGMEWYKAKLLPTADSIFSASFYPTNEDASVYCALNSITDSHNRVLVVSRMNESSVRLMTPHLAAFCIEVIGEASDAENNQLNELTSGMLNKIGCVEND